MPGESAITPWNRALWGWRTSSCSSPLHVQVTIGVIRGPKASIFVPFRFPLWHPLVRDDCNSCLALLEG